MSRWSCSAPSHRRTSRGAYLVAAVVMVLFVAVAFGFMTHAGWWRPVAVAAATISIIEIAVFFDGLPPANTLAALAFNVAVIVAIQVNWPSAEILVS